MNTISLSLAVFVLLAPVQTTAIEKSGEKSAALKPTTPRQRKIVKLRREIKGLFTRRERLRKKFGRTAAWSVLADRERSKKKELGELEKSEGPPWYTPMPPAPKLQVGFHGRLYDGTARIEQVVDSLNMLVTIGWPQRFFMKGGKPAATKKAELVWIRGVVTSQLVDGSSTVLTHRFRISETKTYPTTFGSNTVFVLEVVKWSDVQRKTSK